MQMKGGSHVSRMAERARLLRTPRRSNCLINGFGLAKLRRPRHVLPNMRGQQPPPSGGTTHFLARIPNPNTTHSLLRSTDSATESEGQILFQCGNLPLRTPEFAPRPQTNLRLRRRRRICWIRARICTATEPGQMQIFHTHPRGYTVSLNYFCYASK